MNNSKVKVVAITNIEKNLFYMFLFAAILLLSSYLYLVQRSVFNIVARQKAEAEIGTLETKVASMEAEYMAESGSRINPDYAHTLGFRDVTADQNYAVSDKKTAALSLAGHEI